MKQLLNISTETCGSVNITPNNNVYLELQTTGTETPEKCSYVFYRPHIFHTHVLKNKSYPSPDDILKVVKRHEIVSSLVVTHWGIWEICCPIKMKINEKSELGMKTYIQKQVNRMYNKSLDEKLINDIIENLENQYNKNFDFGFTIKFQSWSKLDNDDKFKTKCKIVTTTRKN